MLTIKSRPQSVLSNLICCRLLLRIRHYASDMKDVEYEVTPSLNICAVPIQSSGPDPLLNAWCRSDVHSPVSAG